MKTLINSLLTSSALYAAEGVNGTEASLPTPTKAKRVRKPGVKAKGAAKPDGEKKPRSIVPARFKAAYAEHNDTNGDKLTLALKAATTMENEDGRECLDVKALKTIAAANKIDTAKYAKLNNGQLRMNVINRMRGLIKHGTTVVIGKQSFAIKALVKPDAAPVEKKARKPRAPKATPDASVQA